MRDPSSTAKLLKVGLAAHTPTMAQYLGLACCSVAGKTFEALLLAPLPSSPPSQARQRAPPGWPPPSSPHPGMPIPLQRAK